ncbi:MAG TPA: DNA double-strand break repair nuclease NurA [Armatimonadota bacterium]|nr:DNA double-strand break repair nuclease NurA [Armatimonadota bacterium]
MLDLEALIGDMRVLAGEVVESARATLEQREAAITQLHAARALDDLRLAVQRFGEDMALPAVGLDMGSTHAAPPAEDYTVIATDGSQVAPDYHHIAPWYVINSGCAVFRYGAPEGRERCRLSSHPVLKPPRKGVPVQDILPGAPDADNEDGAADARVAAGIESGQLQVERLKAELALALRLLEEEADPGRTVLLLDGPLVQWRMITDLRGEERNQVIDLFSRLMEAAREARAPVAGFISRSRAVEWVTLLRFTLCPEVASEGRLCEDCRKTLLRGYREPQPTAHHARLAGLRDIELAGKLLLPGAGGSRTEVVELRSKTWDMIANTGAAVGFFYLNTGREISRVELPQWVWEDAALMERLHSVLWDQCELGDGYPMVLAEAHEAAVVRAADRDAFYLVLERILADHGTLDATTSAKARSKRRPVA